MEDKVKGNIAKDSLDELFEWLRSSDGEDEEGLAKDGSALKHAEAYAAQATTLSSSTTSIRANFVSSFNTSTESTMSKFGHMSFDMPTECIAAPKTPRRRGKGKAPKNPAKVIMYNKAGSERRYRMTDTFRNQKELLSALIDEYNTKLPDVSSSASLQSLPPRQTPPPPQVSALFEQYYARKTKKDKRKDEEYVQTLVKKYEPSRNSSKDHIPSRNSNEIVENNNDIYTSSFDELL
jgi:hypothetical protein